MNHMGCNKQTTRDEDGEAGDQRYLNISGWRKAHATTPATSMSATKNATPLAIQPSTSIAAYRIPARPNARSLRKLANTGVETTIAATNSCGAR